MSRRQQSVLPLKKGGVTGLDRSHAGNQKASTTSGYAHYQCYHCKKWGHIRRVCRFLRNQRPYQHGETRRNVSQKREWRAKIPEEVALSCLKVTPDQWLLDSGCSHHMTGEKKNLSKFKKINGGQVKFGGGSCGKIIGK
jgi:hypothetical protein